MWQDIFRDDNGDDVSLMDLENVIPKQYNTSRLELTGEELQWYEQQTLDRVELLANQLPNILIELGDWAHNNEIRIYYDTNDERHVKNISEHLGFVCSDNGWGRNGQIVPDDQVHGPYNDYIWVSPENYQPSSTRSLFSV